MVYNKDMKNKLALITMIVLLALLTGSLSNIPQVFGYYNTTFDTLYAVNEYVCMHEIAHVADVKSGWISKTDEWIKVAEPYKDIYDYEDVGYRASQIFTEVYADLYSDVMGHAEGIPQELLKFYDFGMLHNLRMEYCNGY